jgi:hypothetical protein
MKQVQVGFFQTLFCRPQHPDFLLSFAISRHIHPYHFEIVPYTNYPGPASAEAGYGEGGQLYDWAKRKKEFPIS